MPEVEAQGHARIGGAIEAYRLYGSLFFGAVHRLEELTDPGQPTPKIMILSISNLLNLDTSGLEALENLLATLRKKQCRLLIAGANGQPLSMMKRGGFIQDIGGENLFENTAKALDFAARVLEQKEPQLL